MFFLITPFAKDVCILLGIVCIGFASAVQAVEFGMNRDVNRYLVVSGTAGGHMDRVYFDTRAAADGAYDAIENGDSRVLMDTRRFERAAGVLRRDAKDAFVRLVRQELREQKQRLPAHGPQLFPGRLNIATTRETVARLSTPETNVVAIQALYTKRVQVLCSSAPDGGSQLGAIRSRVDKPAVAISTAVFTQTDCAEPSSLWRATRSNPCPFSAGISSQRHRENEAACDLLEELKKLEAVTKELQRSSLTLSGVRRLFDRVLRDFPHMRGRLGDNASIINYAALESGLVKIQRGEQLMAAERSACAAFRAETPTPSAPTKSESYVGSALKKRRVARREVYVETAYVPPTSNECERFFSKAKLVLTDNRKSMDPETLETLMYLSHNRPLRNVYSVEAIRKIGGSDFQ